MGGDLSATSTPGAGSTFALRLAARVTPRSADAGSTADVRTPPAALTPAMAAAAAFLEEPPPDAGARETLREVPGGQTVVVFGPDEEALAALGRVLYPDVRLLRVNDAAGVARAVRETAASLVVVDVTAADGQGWDIAHALRAEPGLEEVPLLLLPTRSPRAVRGAATAFDLGVVAFAERLAPRIGEERPEPTGTDAPPATADDAAVRLARTVERIAARPRTPHGPGEPLPRGQVADVLLVDDDPDARRITARVLRAAGAEVREAPDGESALDAMRRRRPDVAVVDLMMPVVDGFGLLTAMRADPRLRGVPVVVLTTKALTPAERRYLARTAEEVLEKGEHRMSDVATLILRAAKR
jgi:CheY-like chemotaxis protein